MARSPPRSLPLAASDHGSGTRIQTAKRRRGAGAGFRASGHRCAGSAPPFRCVNRSQVIRALLPRARRRALAVRRSRARSFVLHHSRPALLAAEASGRTRIASPASAVAAPAGRLPLAPSDRPRRATCSHPTSASAERRRRSPRWTALRSRTPRARWLSLNDVERWLGLDAAPRHRSPDRACTHPPSRIERAPPSLDTRPPTRDDPRAFARFGPSRRAGHRPTRSRDRAPGHTTLAPEDHQAGATPTRARTSGVLGATRWPALEPRKTLDSRR